MVQAIISAFRRLKQEDCKLDCKVARMIATSATCFKNSGVRYWYKNLNGQRSSGKVTSDPHLSFLALKRPRIFLSPSLLLPMSFYMSLVLQNLYGYYWSASSLLCFLIQGKLYWLCQECWCAIKISHNSRPCSIYFAFTPLSMWLPRRPLCRTLRYPRTT